MDATEPCLQPYIYRYLVHHLDAADLHDALLQLLCDSDFLADQARHSGNFRHGLADLERYALSAARQRRDWQRFLHLAQITQHLRDLAHDLAREDVLLALLNGGHTELAADLLAQLPLSHRRIDLRRRVLATLPPYHLPTWQQALHSDIEELAQTQTDSTVNPTSQHLGSAVLDPCTEGNSVDESQAQTVARRRLGELSQQRAPCCDSDFGHQLWDLVRRLRQLRYRLGTQSLCQFADLIAQHLPDHLDYFLTTLLLSPSGTPNLLLTLARQSESSTLGSLYAHADRYVITVAPSRVAGLQLRYQLLKLLVPRLCAERGNLDLLDDPWLHRALLPDELNDLRLRIAQHLLRSGRPSLAATLVQHRDHRLEAVLLRLRLDSRNAEKQLEPRLLYDAAATKSPLYDEVLARQALARATAAPRSPTDPPETTTDGVRSPNHDLDAGLEQIYRLPPGLRRILALCELASAVPLSDCGALQTLLTHELDHLDNEEQLARRLPDLITVSQRQGPSHARAELHSAMQRLLLVPDLPRRWRYPLLESLIRQSSTWIGGSGTPSPFAALHLAWLYRAWLGLPRSLHLEGNALAAWLKLLPTLRLQLRQPRLARVRWLMDTPLRDRLQRAAFWSTHCAPVATEAVLGILQRWLPEDLRDRLNRSQQRYLDICLASPTHLSRLHPDQLDTDEIAAAVLLRPTPEIHELDCWIQALPPGSQRQLVLATWLRHWLHNETLTRYLLAALTAPATGDPVLAARTIVLAGLPADSSSDLREHWLQALTTCLRAGALTEEDLLFHSVRPTLRTFHDSRARAALASATEQALLHSSSTAGRTALLAWLCIYLTSPGSNLKRTAEALQQARTLRHAAPHIKPEPPSTGPQPLHNRWKHTWQRLLPTMSKNGAWRAQAGGLSYTLVACLLSLLFLFPPAAPQLAEASFLSALFLFVASTTIVGQGWWIFRWLMLRTHLSQDCCTGRRLLWSLLGSLPVFGLWVVPYWLYRKQRDKTCPALPAESPADDPDGIAPSPRCTRSEQLLHTLMRHLGGSWTWRLAFLAPGFCTLGLLGLALPADAALPRNIRFALGGLLALSALVAYWHAVEDLRRREALTPLTTLFLRAFVVFVNPLTFLLPVLLLSLTRSLRWASQARRFLSTGDTDSVANVPVTRSGSIDLRTFRETLQETWREHPLRRFVGYHKLTLLAFEAALLGASWDSAPALLTFTLPISAILATLGLVGFLLVSYHRHYRKLSPLRLVLDRYPYASFLALTQGLWLLGLWLGISAGETYAATSAELLDSGRFHITWLVLTCPCMLLLPRLIAPHHLLDAFRSSTRPADRWILQFLIFFALLPCTGLLLPLWLFVWHIRWPVMQQ